MLSVTLTTVSSIVTLCLCSSITTIHTADAFQVVAPPATGHGRAVTETSRYGRLFATGSTTTRKSNKSGDGNKRKPSRVVDPDGPTPDYENVDIEQIDPDDIIELRDIRDPAELPHPIPHQPWRRGDTAGCEAPIAAEWRREAEDVIQKAATLVGARVLDVTWYLTAVIVTLDEEMMPAPDMLKSSGPVIEIKSKGDPVYQDPSDPNPEDIWGDHNRDEGEIMYQHETEEEAEATRVRKNMMYATRDAEDPVDEPHIPDQAGDGDTISLYKNIETRSDIALKVQEDELERDEELEKPIDLETLRIDTAALSTIAEAILNALKLVEDDLRILARHELILTSPGPPDVLETQRQFDAYRGSPIVVETKDPFDSNRTLKGKLVDRNAMDLIISKKGRMITIPLNFIKCVRLPSASNGNKSDKEAAALTTLAP